MKEDYTWADEANKFNEQIEALQKAMPDGCSFWLSYTKPGCPFEGCLLVEDDWKEILGRYCYGLGGQGFTNKEIGKTINRCTSSVWSYKKCVKDT